MAPSPLSPSHCLDCHLHRWLDIINASIFNLFALSFAFKLPLWVTAWPAYYLEDGTATTDAELLLSLSDSPDFSLPHLQRLTVD